MYDRISSILLISVTTSVKQEGTQISAKMLPHDD